MDLLVERDQEVVVALGIDLAFRKAVDFGILVLLVLVDQGSLSLNLCLGRACVLLAGGVVLGQMFL